MKARIAFLFLAMTLAASAVAPAAGAVTIGDTAPPSATGGCTDCYFVQVGTESFSPSYVVPASGVITSFSSQIGSVVDPSDLLRFYVFRAVTASSYTLISTTGPLQIPAASAGQIANFPVRIQATAGDQLGLGIRSGISGSNTVASFIPSSTGSNDQTGSFGASEPSVGATAPLSGSATGSHRLNVLARVEPDADGDGFGDETQDLCSTDATRQGPCFFADIAAPVITQFSSQFKRFRVKPQGAVISKRAHPGTTIRLNLSEPATVSFVVEKLFRGKITNGVCKKAGKKNRKNRRCTKTIHVHAFSRALVTGRNTFPYSARYLDAKGRVGKLHPGPYRITAVATDAAGNVSAPDTAGFKVRH